MIKRILHWLGWISAGTLVLTEELEHPPKEKQSAEAGHELSDMSSGLIAVLALVMIISAVIMHLSLGAELFHLRKIYENKPSKTADASVLQSRSLPPTPYLQNRPKDDYRAYMTSQRRTLESYAWVDQPNHIARIPIARAMEIFLSRQQKESSRESR